MTRSRVSRARGLGAVAVVLALATAATVPAPAQDEAVPGGGEYRIGVEDRLRIEVWKQPELSLGVLVRPDGMITVPLVGDVQADGRTPSQLSTELSTALGRFVREPIVTVIVEDINHFKVYVLGEVASQGVLLLKKPTRVLQALALSGGLTAYADKSQVYVVRYEGEQETRIRVDYKKILNGQDTDTNILLKPGDMILVK